MSNPHPGQLLTQIRRKDRAVTDEAWIRALLHRSPFGVLATSVGGQPFAHTNLFVYHQPDHAIYFHSARMGRTPDNLRENPRVCFSVAKMGRLLPANTALAFSVEYASVMVFGAVTLLTGPAEQERALQLLLNKYFPHLQPGRDYRPITPEELEKTAVYRLDIEQWSGKQKQVKEDFPGAFFYPEFPQEGN